jgi:hypothetical protein
MYSLIGGKLAKASSARKNSKINLLLQTEVKYFTKHHFPNATLSTLSNFEVFVYQIQLK